MPAAPSDMMFGDVPVGSMPAAPTQMVRPEGPAAGMPRALPSATSASFGLIAPQVDAAPSMTSFTDPLIGGTRAPSAFRPINTSLQEMRPRIEPTAARRMSYEEYVPYISDLYRKEYGVAPTEQQLISAYQVYTQSMGM